MKTVCEIEESVMLVGRLFQMVGAELVKTACEMEESVMFAGRLFQMVGAELVKPRRENSVR